MASSDTEAKQDYGLGYQNTLVIKKIKNHDQNSDPWFIWKKNKIEKIMLKMNKNLLIASQGTTKVLKNTMKLGWINIRRMASKQKKDQMVVPKDDVVRFICECMCKVGVPSESGQIVGHHLMTADYSGHFSHGMNRVPMYVKDIQTKRTDPVAQPEIVTDFQAIALVDGKNGLGQVIGKCCMELAMKKAKKFGVGLVSVKGSNHYGTCGYYTMMAIKENLIGFTCTNTSPLMAPTRSKCAALGTNPLGLGMGASNKDLFNLDMATTTVALGKIELAKRKKEPIPEGWALDSDGKMTTDAEKAFEAAVLMPLGGTEHNAGYKGYGLALMVEILCGILSGSKFGPNIRKWKGSEEIANLGHCFLAIDPEAFGCGSQDRLTKLLKQLRELPTVADKPVMIPGDYERTARKRVDKEGGISYHPNQLKASKQLADEIGVEPMKLIPKKSVC